MYTPVHKRFTILDVLTHAKNVYCIIVERDKNYRSLFNFISLSLGGCENIVNFAQCRILKILVNQSVDRNTWLLQRTAATFVRISVKPTRHSLGSYWLRPNEIGTVFVGCRVVIKAREYANAAYFPESRPRTLVYVSIVRTTRLTSVKPYDRFNAMDVKTSSAQNGLNNGHSSGHFQ